MPNLTKDILTQLYAHKGLSVSAIAKKFKVSQSKINYWLAKYNIPKRSISDAVYLKHNPKGNPFLFKTPISQREWLLLGLGIGLYWGEGNKKSQSSVRLGNVDPKLIKAFRAFLEKTFLVDKTRFKFGLQIFSDTSPKVAKEYWMRELKLKSTQFYKVTVTPSRGIGTYKNKSQYGVLTIYFNNVKLQRVLRGVIENFPSM